MADFDAYRERTLREVKNKQAAELSARSDLSSAETQQVVCLLVKHVFFILHVIIKIALRPFRTFLRVL